MTIDIEYASSIVDKWTNLPDNIAAVSDKSIKVETFRSAAQKSPKALTPLD